MNSYKERAERAREAKEKYRVDVGRLCVCPICSGEHFRKETKEVAMTETYCWKSMTDWETDEFSGLGVCLLPHGHEGEHKFTDAENVRVSIKPENVRRSIEAAANENFNT